MGERKFDRVFGAVIWGFMLFVIPFCTAWWITYALTREGWALGLGCALGVASGIACNFLFLKKLSSHPYSQKTWVAVLLLVLYSVGLFGFFMGVPVFNILAGALAAIYIGRQAKVLGYDKVRFSQQIKHTQGLLSLIMLIVCGTSAFIALSDSYTAANLEGMFSLGFTLTQPMLLAIIFLGGGLLLMFQATLVKALAFFAYNR